MTIYPPIGDPFTDSPLYVPVVAMPKTREGWKCPGCKHYYSPDVEECKRCAPDVIGSITITVK